MKKLILLLPVLLFMFSSCDKEEMEELNAEIDLLQDNLGTVVEQYESLLDSIAELSSMINDSEVDLKALQMEQIASLFDAIARQPEAADFLIGATETLYEDYTLLLPLSDKAILQRGQARGIAFSGLFEAIGRQPEAFPKLDSAAAKFLGVYDAAEISDELLDFTRAYSVSALNESIARQPEADSLFNIATTRYLNFKVSE